MSTREVKMFACACGARDEGDGAPPLCWHCGAAMYQWATRSSCGGSSAITAEKADSRTANGGY